MSSLHPPEDLLAHGQDCYAIDIIAEEIIAYTGDTAENVWRRLAQELDKTGTNVVNETRRFGVTPHVFNQQMVDFYTRSDGFIYETSVESRNPYRLSKWLKIAEFLADDDAPRSKRRILVYGDSVGNDCIFLKRMGFSVSYHDYDSRCSRYARQRFARRNLDIPSFAPGTTARFDHVICFEVAEHVPDPEALTGELASLTDERGCCIFSESFNLIKPQFPTHLLSNVRFTGKADAMFAKHGMHVAWRDVDEKPIVYTRCPSKFARDPKSGGRFGVLSTIRRKLGAAYHA